MSIVKDFYFMLFIFMLICCFAGRIYTLKKELAEQKNYFINTLNHDLKVSILANLRGINLLSENVLSQDELTELLTELKSGCEYSMNMVSMLLNSLAEEKPVLTLESLSLPAMLAKIIINKETDTKLKNLKFISKISNCCVFADSKFLLKILDIITSKAIEESKRDSEILCLITKNNKKCQLLIKYKNTSINKNFKRTPLFSTVGNNIKIKFCSKIIKSLGGNFKICTDSNSSTILTIELPIYNEKQCIKMPVSYILKPYQ